MIYRYCIKEEELENVKNKYYIGNGSVLSNPYTHIKDKKNKGFFNVKDKETAVKMYSSYYDIMYNGNVTFRDKIDEIYNKYVNGEDVYLGCNCKLNETCHGDIIIDKLRSKLTLELIKNERRNIIQQR